MKYQSPLTDLLCVYEFQDSIQTILFVNYQSASDRCAVGLTDMWRVQNVATVTTHFQLEKACEETADRKAGDIVCKIPVRL